MGNCCFVKVKDACFFVFLVGNCWMLFFGMFGMLVGWVWRVLHCFVDFFGLGVFVSMLVYECRQNRWPRFLTYMAASFNSDTTGIGSKLDTSC